MDEKAKVAFTRKLIEFLRDHLRLQADCESLQTILNTAVALNQPPFGWQEALEGMRQSEKYKECVAQGDELFRQGEETADIREIQQLLESMPSTRLPN